MWASPLDSRPLVSPSSSTSCCLGPTVPICCLAAPLADRILAAHIGHDSLFLLGCGAADRSCWARPAYIIRMKPAICFMPLCKLCQLNAGFSSSRGRRGHVHSWLGLRRGHGTARGGGRPQRRRTRLRRWLARHCVVCNFRPLLKPSREPRGPALPTPRHLFLQTLSGGAACRPAGCKLAVTGTRHKLQQLRAQQRRRAPARWRCRSRPSSRGWRPCCRRSAVQPLAPHRSTRPWTSSRRCTWPCSLRRPAALGRQSVAPPSGECSSLTFASVATAVSAIPRFACCATIHQTLQLFRVCLLNPTAAVAASVCRAGCWVQQWTS